MRDKKKKDLKLFDSTSNVQIIGTKELAQELQGEEDLMIKGTKNSDKSPDR
eukprot:jgi/Antlo1/1075/1672